MKGEKKLRKRVLITGIGSHVGRVFDMMEDNQVDRIYIVQNNVNTDEFDIKIKELKEQV